MVNTVPAHDGLVPYCPGTSAGLVIVMTQFGLVIWKMLPFDDVIMILSHGDGPVWALC